MEEIFFDEFLRFWRMWRNDLFWFMSYVLCKGAMDGPKNRAYEGKDGGKGERNNLRR